jgi:hypothetical protein
VLIDHIDFCGHPTLGGGGHGYAGIVMDPARYLLSKSRDVSSKNIPNNATQGFRARVEAEHKELVKEYETFQGVVQATKDIVLEAVDNEGFYD